MVYCVVPRPLVYELYDRLVDYYQDDDNVTVIVDRRTGDRRKGGRGARGSRAYAEAAPRRVIRDQRRVIRDRRRARIPGDLPPFATA
jgi:hypothetical protein